MEGGFMIRLDPTGIDVYVTAELSFGIGDAQITYGEATGVLIVKTGIGGGIPGVAGYLKVSSTADIGLPNLGELFSATGEITVMFNTTLRDQLFEIPESFHGLLEPDDPRTIEIYAAAPGLDGQRDLLAAPEIYFQATIAAELRLANTITLTGFIQIEAAAALADGTGRFNIVGAVGTEIEHLGALTGTLNFTMFVGVKTGIVGRVQLALDVNGIPGVEL